MVNKRLCRDNWQVKLSDNADSSLTKMGALQELATHMYIMPVKERGLEMEGYKVSKHCFTEHHPKISPIFPFIGLYICYQVAIFRFGQLNI